MDNVIDKVIEPEHLGRQLILFDVGDTGSSRRLKRHSVIKQRGFTILLWCLMVVDIYRAREH